MLGGEHHHHRLSSQVVDRLTRDDALDSIKRAHLSVSVPVAVSLASMSQCVVGVESPLISLARGG
jgi:hypothetical protein